METGETGETLFFIAIGIRGLGCEKNREILQISKKCYFFIHFPKTGLAGEVLTVENWPVSEVKFMILKVLPMAGTKPLIRLIFKVPFRSLMFSLPVIF